MDMSNLVINALFDGDIHAKIESVPYSTNVREIFTVGELVRLYEMGKIE